VKQFVGNTQGKQTGNLVPSHENLVKKHYYLHQLFEYCACPEDSRKQEVYTDKSYIHKHDNKNNDSIWDLIDATNIIYQKEKHKGQCYSFCAVVQDPNPRNPAVDKARMVPFSL
jgi:hypothetical protein